MNTTDLFEQLKAIPRPNKITIEPLANGVRFTYSRYTHKEVLGVGTLMAGLGLLVTLMAFGTANLAAVLCASSLFVGFAAFVTLLRLALGVHEACGYMYDLGTGRLTGIGTGIYAGTETTVPLPALRDLRKERDIWTRTMMYQVIATDMSGKKQVLIGSCPGFQDGEACAAFFVRALQLCAQASRERDQAVE